MDTYEQKIEQKINAVNALLTNILKGSIKHHFYTTKAPYVIGEGPEWFDESLFSYETFTKYHLQFKEIYKDFAEYELLGSLAEIFFSFNKPPIFRIQVSFPENENKIYIYDEEDLRYLINGEAVGCFFHGKDGYEKLSELYCELERVMIFHLLSN